MYNSRSHLYYPQNYFLGRFLVQFIRQCVPRRTVGQPVNRSRRRRTIVVLILCFLVLPSLPLSYAVFCNYRWEHNQPPRTVVPNLVGLDLQTGMQSARAAHLGTEVLGKTWYTDLSPGRITLQSPEAGDVVPFETVIGVELSIPTPAVLAPKTAHPKPDQ